MKIYTVLGIDFMLDPLVLVCPILVVIMVIAFKVCEWVYELIGGDE